MNLTVSGIVGGVNDHNSTVKIFVCADDWAAELAVKASNGLSSVADPGFPEHKLHKICTTHNFNKTSTPYESPYRSPDPPMLSVYGHVLLISRGSHLLCKYLKWT